MNVSIYALDVWMGGWMVNAENKSSLNRSESAGRFGKTFQIPTSIGIQSQTMPSQNQTHANTLLTYNNRLHWVLRPCCRLWNSWTLCCSLHSVCFVCVWVMIYGNKSLFGINRYLDYCEASALKLWTPRILNLCAVCFEHFDCAALWIFRAFYTENCIVFLSTKANNNSI